MPDQKPMCIGSELVAFAKQRSGSKKALLITVGDDDEITLYHSGFENHTSVSVALSVALSVTVADGKTKGADMTAAQAINRYTVQSISE